MALENPLISIIVPVYNVERYLQKCVDSLLEQAYQNLEIILVDDGSPDNCPQLCDSLAKEYPQIVAVHKENGGLGSARNFGVEHAHGEWIVFVDSDDYVLPNYVEDMWRLQQEYKADLVSCNITPVDEDDHVLGKGPQCQNICMVGREAFAEIYFYGKSGWRSYSKLLHRDLVKKYPFPEGYYEDFATSYKYFIDCQKVVISSNGENYRYLQREGSILNAKLTENHLHAFDICETISNYVKVCYPEYESLIYILYLRQVIQILNKLSMSKEDFKRIFKRYQKLFRQNLVRGIRDRNLAIKSKAYLIALCMAPPIYKGIKRVAKII